MFVIKDKFDFMDGFFVKKINFDNIGILKDIYMFYNKEVKVIIELFLKDIIIWIKKIV